MAGKGLSHSGKGAALAGRKSQSRSVAAGLLLPVGSIGSKLRRRKHVKNTGHDTPVALAAVVEYVIREVLDLSQKLACQKPFDVLRLTPRHVFLSLNQDIELKKLFEGGIFVRGGVIPDKIDTKKAIAEAKREAKKRAREGEPAESDQDDPPSKPAKKAKETKEAEEEPEDEKKTRKSKRAKRG